MTALEPYLGRLIVPGSFTDLDLVSEAVAFLPMLPFCFLSVGVMSGFFKGGRLGESAREVCSVSGLPFSSCTGVMPILVVLADEVVEEVVEEVMEEVVCDRSALGEGVSVSTIIDPLTEKKEGSRACCYKEDGRSRWQAIPAVRC